MKSKPSQRRAGKPFKASALLKKVPRLKPALAMNGDAGVVAALLEERRNSR